MVVVVEIQVVEVHVMGASPIVLVVMPCMALNPWFLWVVVPLRADVNLHSPPEVELLIQVLHRSRGHEDPKDLCAPCALSERLPAVPVVVLMQVQF